MVFGPPVSQRFEKRKEKFVLGSSEIHQIPVLLALCTRMSRPCGVIGHQQGRGLTAPAVPACKAAAASGAQLLSSSQPPAKLTRREDISGRFQYFRIYSLLSFYSQDKKAQLKAGTGPFVFPSPDTARPSLTLPITRPHPSFAPNPARPSARSQPSATFPPVRPHCSSRCTAALPVPACARDRLSTEPQCSFRTSILGADGHTRPPRLPIMTGRL